MCLESLDSGLISCFHVGGMIEKIATHDQMEYGAVIIVCTSMMLVPRVCVRRKVS